MSDGGVQELAVTRTQSLRQEIAGLKEFMASLPKDALSLPSACTEWQVQDVVAHLVTAAENWSRILAGALDGEPPSTLGGRTTRNPPDENAQGAIELRKTLGDQLVPTFLENIDRVDQVLGQITSKDWETPVRHNSDGEMPLRSYINSVTRGVGVHGWDIRSGVDREAELGPDCVPALVDAIELWLRVFCFHPTAALAEPLRFRFQLTGPVTGTRDVLVRGDDFAVEVDGASQADIVYRCGAGDFVLMAYGRLSRPEAQSRGRLIIEGNEDLAARFDEWFNTG